MTSESHKPLREKLNKVYSQGQKIQKTLQYHQNQLKSLEKSDVNLLAVESSIEELAQLYSNIDAQITPDFPQLKFNFLPSNLNVPYSVKYSGGTSPTDMMLCHNRKPKLKEIKTNLKRKIIANELSKNSNVDENDCVIAVDMKRMVVRGIVMGSAKGELLTILDIDTGDYKIATLENIYELDEEAVSLYALWVHCALDGDFTDLNKYWTPDLSNYFVSALKIGALVMEFRNNTDESTIPPIFKVSLEVFVNDTKVLNVNDWLCSQLLPVIKREAEDCVDLRKVIRGLDSKLLLPYMYDSSLLLSESHECSSQIISSSVTSPLLSEVHLITQNIEEKTSTLQDKSQEAKSPPLASSNNNEGNNIEDESGSTCLDKSVSTLNNLHRAKSTDESLGNDVTPPTSYTFLAISTPTSGKSPVNFLPSLKRTCVPDRPSSPLSTFINEAASRPAAIIAVVFSSATNLPITSHVAAPSSARNISECIGMEEIKDKTKDILNPWQGKKSSRPSEDSPDQGRVSQLSNVSSEHLQPMGELIHKFERNIENTTQALNAALDFELSTVKELARNQKTLAQIECLVDRKADNLEKFNVNGIENRDNISKNIHVDHMNELCENQIQDISLANNKDQFSNSVSINTDRYQQEVINTSNKWSNEDNTNYLNNFRTTQDCDNTTNLNNFDLESTKNESIPIPGSNDSRVTPKYEELNRITIDENLNENLLVSSSDSSVRRDKIPPAPVKETSLPEEEVTLNFETFIDEAENQKSIDDYVIDRLQQVNNYTRDGYFQPVQEMKVVNTQLVDSLSETNLASMKETSIDSPYFEHQLYNTSKGISNVNPTESYMTKDTNNIHPDSEVIENSCPNAEECPRINLDHGQVNEEQSQDELNLVVHSKVHECSVRQSMLYEVSPPVITSTSSDPKPPVPELSVKKMISSRARQRKLATQAVGDPGPSLEMPENTSSSAQQSFRNSNKNSNSNSTAHEQNAEWNTMNKAIVENASGKYDTDSLSGESCTNTSVTSEEKLAVSIKTQKWSESTLKQASLLKDHVTETIKVQVTRVPAIGEFYCQTVGVFPEDDVRFKVLFCISNLKDVYPRFQLTTPIRYGKLVMVRDPQTKLWYRAEVIGKVVTQDLFRVFFVDFGTEYYVQGNVICKIPPNLITLPYRAIHCQLHNIAVSQDPCYLNSEEHTRHLQVWKSMVKVGETYELKIMEIMEAKNSVGVSMESDGFDMGQMLALQCYSSRVEVKTSAMSGSWSDFVKDPAYQ